MKYYDYNKAKSIIEEKKDQIERASLAMKEDWSWTADDVFIDGEYTKSLDSETLIAGINGSSWATPTLRIEYKDGEEEDIDCSTGESDPDDETEFQRLFTEITKKYLS